MWFRVGVVVVFEEGELLDELLGVFYGLSGEVGEGGGGVVGLWCVGDGEEDVLVEWWWGGAGVEGDGVVGGVVGHDVWWGLFGVANVGGEDIVFVVFIIVFIFIIVAGDESDDVGELVGAMVAQIDVVDFVVSGEGDVWNGCGLLAQVADGDDCHDDAPHDWILVYVGCLCA